MAMPSKKTRTVFLLTLFLGAVFLVVAYKLLGPADPVVDLSGASPMTLTVNKEGHPNEAKPLPANAKLVSVIEKILAAKSGRWSWTIVSYVPVVYVRGDLFTINFQSSRVIVNYTTANGRRLQVVSDLTSDEMAALHEEIK